MGLDPHGEPKLQGPHLLTRAVVGVPVTRQRRCRRPGKHPATIPWKHPEQFVPSMGAERREATRWPVSLERPALPKEIDDTPVLQRRFTVDPLLLTRNRAEHQPLLLEAGGEDHLPQWRREG